MIFTIEVRIIQGVSKCIVFKQKSICSESKCLNRHKIIKDIMLLQISLLVSVAIAFLKQNDKFLN